MGIWGRGDEGKGCIMGINITCCRREEGKGSATKKKNISG
jgi:hypothetical protein